MASAVLSYEIDDKVLKVLCTRELRPWTVQSLADDERLNYWQDVPALIKYALERLESSELAHRAYDNSWSPTDAGRSRTAQLIAGNHNRAAA